MRLIGLAAVLTVIVALAPLAVEAQPAGRTVTIGYLGNSSPSTNRTSSRRYAKDSVSSDTWKGGI
jgi:hypothetical protein